LDIFLSAPQPVSITFDDGNASDLEVALPALKERGLNAKFFVVTSRIATKGYLSEDDIRRLSTEGMGIGSHGFEHVPWTGLSETELERQLRRSLADLQSVLGRRIDEVAVPFGRYNRTVLSVLRRANVKRVHSSDTGAIPKYSWIVPRLSFRADTNLATIADMCARSPTMLDQARSLVRLWRRSRRTRSQGHADRRSQFAS
jgi:peptidoglycan/xylan/chitin deacetylase (PgdA/CDA1 family)